jgi:nicotinamide mononucleotide transporter
MGATDWLRDNYIEIFGAITGIIYVFLEIRQKIWLWPLGIVTSSVYIWVFFTSKFYADMSLQFYYLVISVFGWYWWVKKSGRGKKIERVGDEENVLVVTRIRFNTAVKAGLVYILLHSLMWVILARFTDSPVPGWDSFITSLSVVATWMLARKIYEHWYLWVIINISSAVIFLSRGLYPTVVLYIVYGIMSFAGLIEWRKDLKGRSWA